MFGKFLEALSGRPTKKFAQKRFFFFLSEKFFWDPKSILEATCCPPPFGSPQDTPLARPCHPPIKHKKFSKFSENAQKFSARFARPIFPYYIPHIDFFVKEKSFASEASEKILAILPDQKSIFLKENRFSKGKN